MLWKCENLLKEGFKKEKSNYWIIQLRRLKSLCKSNISKLYFKFWDGEYLSMTRAKGSESYLKERYFHHTYCFVYLYLCSSLLYLPIYPYIYNCALTDMARHWNSTLHYKTVWIKEWLPRFLQTNIILSITLQAD